MVGGQALYDTYTDYELAKLAAREFYQRAKAMGFVKLAESIEVR
jgi:hypothetical protein